MKFIQPHHLQEVCDTAYGICGYGQQNIFELWLTLQLRSRNQILKMWLWSCFQNPSVKKQRLGICCFYWKSECSLWTDISDLRPTANATWRSFEKRPIRAACCRRCKNVNTMCGPCSVLSPSLWICADMVSYPYMRTNIYIHTHPVLHIHTL